VAPVASIAPVGCPPVMLVGAGPGDPELLTVKAVRAIAAADTILVDDLVDPAVLAHARPAARITWVGKRGGCPSTPQAFIERLMIREARSGARVVRLKGGDPLIFGRAGEEIAALRAAGVPYGIVNGITSALAAAAELGFSLTHRAHCHGVAFVTGHPQEGTATPGRELAGWQAMIASGVTLAVYMGLTRVDTWRRGLLDAGIDPATPVACVEAAGGARRRYLVTTVGQLAVAVGEHGIRSPAMMLVGPAAGEASVPQTIASAAEVPAAKAPPPTTAAVAPPRSARRHA
jgi:uroporphyrin-III C-methyltransferase